MRTFQEFEDSIKENIIFTHGWYKDLKLNTSDLSVYASSARGFMRAINPTMKPHLVRGGYQETGSIRSIGKVDDDYVKGYFETPDAKREFDNKKEEMLQYRGFTHLITLGQYALHNQETKGLSVHINKSGFRLARHPVFNTYNSMVIMAFNGTMIHEGVHSTYTTVPALRSVGNSILELWDELDPPTDKPSPRTVWEIVDEYKHTKRDFFAKIMLLQGIYNVVEDVTMEAWIKVNFPKLYPFIEGKNQILFNPGCAITLWNKDMGSWRKPSTHWELAASFMPYTKAADTFADVFTVEAYDIVLTHPNLVDASLPLIDRMFEYYASIRRPDLTWDDRQQAIQDIYRMLMEESDDFGEGEGEDGEQEGDEGNGAGGGGGGFTISIESTNDNEDEGNSTSSGEDEEDDAESKPQPKPESNEEDDEEDTESESNEDDGEPNEEDGDAEPEPDPAKELELEALAGRMPEAIMAGVPSMPETTPAKFEDMMIKVTKVINEDVDLFTDQDYPVLVERIPVALNNPYPDERMNALQTDFGRNLQQAKVRRTSYQEFNRNKGRIVPIRLWRAVGDRSIFGIKKERTRSKVDYDFTILVDTSGSMWCQDAPHEWWDTRFEAAFGVTWAVYKSLIKAGLPCEVYYHMSNAPGMNSKSEHKGVVIGQVATRAMTLTQVKENIKMLMAVPSIMDIRREHRYSFNADNMDGHAILWIGKHVMQAKKSKKQPVLIVVSDGAPSANNYYGYKARDHTRLAANHLRDGGIIVKSVSITDNAMRANDFIYGEEHNRAANTEGLIEVARSIMGL